jgi:isoleucyl-tRNA synthetase
MDLRNTLNLPDPDFTIPMKADLPKLEPAIQARWEEEQIYHVIQKAREGSPEFVLHDGPPYTNSPVHIGTALNKILKDFVIKSRTMMGFRVPYVPGFDNHGLPIEQAVMKKFSEKKLSPSVVEFRRACREHAGIYLGVQTDQFKRLGVFGLWEKPYATMNFKFEAEIIRIFNRMVLGGYVYKGLRPTLWSPTQRTALADTEIIYKDHVSKAIYVRFPLLEDPNRLFEKFANFYTIIWTTTPWTIPANLAVAFHPLFEYAVVRVGQDHYLVLASLASKLAEELGWESYEIVERLDGINLERVLFKHPIFNRPSIAVMAEYVTTEDGTGVVHTAPSHGRDDFYTGHKYGLPVPNTVDEKGILTAEAGEFAGISYKDCDTVVVDRLREVGALLKVSDYEHSYPYSERDEKPVIFRATEQWFVAIDHDGLRNRMMAQIPKVKWFPPQGQNRIEAMISGRPDWCISRQRPWGVGIPVFYGAKSRTPVLDPVAIESVARLVEREGSDAWFERDASEILPPGYVHPDTGETEFVKETDVLDVWFDAGCTSLCVLEGNVEPEWKEPWPADLYLEGSDQHRGWFNSSLVIATATRGQAPYKQVVTHGWVMDEKGMKLSKRLGNSVDPVEACDKYGADVIRVWVASVDYGNDVRISENLLKQVGDIYRTIRNTLRFLLGNLSGLQPGDDVPLLPLDAWIVEQVDLLSSNCVEAYDNYAFGEVINSLHNFCAKELSKQYLDSIKDRMYCEAADSDLRKSGQIACRYVLTRLVKLVAPILVHTAEETWSKLGESGSVHSQTFDEVAQERLEAIEGGDLQNRYSAIWTVREDVFAAFEQWKGTDGVKDTQDAIVTIVESGVTLRVLQTFGTEELAILFKMSWVELKEGEQAVSFRKSPFLKCERSRIRRPDVELVGEIPLTKRDRAAVGL